MAKKIKVPFVMPEPLSPIDNANGALIDFYRALGWDSKVQQLDCKKVRLSPKDHKALTETLMDIPGVDKNKVSLLLLNYGPSADETVQEGTIVLLEGAITDDN